MIKQVEDFSLKSFKNYTGPNEVFKPKNIIFGYNGRDKSSLALGLKSTYLSKSTTSEENLYRDETYKFIENAFRDSRIQTGGTTITKIVSTLSRFSPDQSRGRKRETVLDKLVSFNNRFFDISSGKI